MYAIYDKNPFPPDSLSYKIWARNEEIGTGRVWTATDGEKFILYLYIMGKCIKDVSRISGKSVTAITHLLDKYHIKLDS